MPHDMWKNELAEFIQPTSGIILMREWGHRPYCHIHRHLDAGRREQAVKALKKAEFWEKKLTKLRG